MKRIAMLRREFERRWVLLVDNQDRGDLDEDDYWRRRVSRFEWLLIDTFSDAVSDAKRNLEPRPPEFAYRTMREWCLTADRDLGRILFEIENHCAGKCILRTCSSWRLLRCHLKK